MVNSDFEEQLKSRHQALLDEVQLQQEKLKQLEEMMRLEGIALDEESVVQSSTQLTTAAPPDSNLDTESLNKAARSAQRRNRNRKPLTELQEFVQNLLEQHGRSMPLADIEAAMTDAGHQIPGKGEKANLVQELVGKAPDVFVRLGHGEYGLAAWVRAAAEGIIKSQNGSAGLLVLAPELQKQSLLPHGTYSKENLVEILTGDGSITMSQDERGVLSFSI